MKEDKVIYNSDCYRLSEKLKLARYVALLLLVLTFLLTFFVFREDMTAEHFRYLIRNLDFNPNSALSSGDNIYYEADPHSRYALYKGSPVILDDIRIRAIDGASGVTLSDYHGFSSPSMVCSERYIFVYDTSSDYVNIYDAFGRVRTLEFPGNVMSVCASDGGNFAVCFIPDDEYYTKISVYDDSFAKIREVSKYKNVTGMDMSSDGRLLVSTAAYIGSDGALASEVSVLDTATAEHSDFDAKGSAAVYAAFVGDSLVVVLEDRLQLYTPELSPSLTQTLYFRDIVASGRADSVEASGDCLLLFSDDGGKNAFATLVLPDTGRFFELALEGQEILGAAPYDEGVCVMTDEGLTVVDDDSGDTRSAPLPEGGYDTLISDGESVYLVCESGAVRLNDGLFAGE